MTFANNVIADALRIGRWPSKIQFDDDVVFRPRLFRVDSTYEDGCTPEQCVLLKECVPLEVTPGKVAHYMIAYVPG